jgi:Pyridoxamine 5'-phosphate oxidase
VVRTLIRRRGELTRGESLWLVSSVPFGRIVFTSRALPAIQPVPHLLAGQQIIIRASLGAAISSAVHGTATIVAYQAELIDPVERTGWSVVVIGRARRVAGEALTARYRRSLPWIEEEMDDVIAIDADLVTGFRIAPVPAGEPAFPATAEAGIRQPEAMWR